MAADESTATVELDRVPGTARRVAGPPPQTPGPPAVAEGQAAEEAAGPPPIVQARGLGLRTRRGWVFRDVDLDVRRGELVAVTGAAGSGRTSLLLALAGRFTTNHGTLDRHGRAALGYVPAVTEPEPGLTVAEHVEERLLLLGQARWRRARRRQLVDEALADYPGDRDELLRTVDPYRRHVLGLIMARLEQPALVVADAVDADLSTAERADLWVRLRGLARDGIAVVAACREVDPGVPDRTVTLGADR